MDEQDDDPVCLQLADEVIDFPELLLGMAATSLLMEEGDRRKTRQGVEKNRM